MYDYVFQQNKICNNHKNRRVFKKNVSLQEILTTLLGMFPLDSSPDSVYEVVFIAQHSYIVIMCLFVDMDSKQCKIFEFFFIVKLISSIEITSSLLTRETKRSVTMVRAICVEFGYSILFLTFLMLRRCSLLFQPPRVRNASDSKNNFC